MISASDCYQLNPEILRAYDIRGIVDRTLGEDDVRAVGRAFGTVVVRAGGRTVAVGYDGRLTSPRLEAALVEGLMATGINVLRVGLGPSPMLYYAVHHLAADGGMVLTGSHNPPEYNGIKMSLQGHPYFGESIQELSRIAASGDFVSGNGQVEDREIAAAYVNRLLKDLHTGVPLTIAWDAGNGAVAQVIHRLCDGIPGRHILINDTVDGRFPAHHPDPTIERNLRQLKEVVSTERCDLGIAFDGDGDRIVAVDSRGDVLLGDQLLIILAKPVLADLPGSTIVVDVKASQVFFDEIRRMGGRPVMGQSGHSPIKSLMMETGAPLAGEVSGHIFFGHRYYGFDDALYAAVRLLSVLGESGRTLCELLDELPATVNTPELRIDCPEERKFGVVEEVRERLRDRNGISVCDIDGVRVSTPGGWWLLRPSNTQAALVARCEASNAADLKGLRAELDRQLRLSGVDGTLA